MFPTKQITRPGDRLISRHHVKMYRNVEISGIYGGKETFFAMV